MAIHIGISENRELIWVPMTITARGCQGDIPIEQFERNFPLAFTALKRICQFDRKKGGYLELTCEENSALACFGMDFSPTEPNYPKAKAESAPSIQTESTDSAANQVTTQICNTVASLNKVAEKPSNVRDEVCVAPPCGLPPPLESTELADKPSGRTTTEPFELECQSQGLAAMALQDQHVGNSASADIIQAGPNNDVPACSTSGLDADDPGDAARQSQLDHTSQQAFADENLPKYPPPAQAVAVTAAKKVNRSLHAQPDFEHVQHEFDANGLSLKMLWDQYCQSQQLLCEL